MKRRIYVALALMIALMLSVCAIADEYETVELAPEAEEVTTVVEPEVSEAEDFELGEAVEELPVVEEPAVEEPVEEEPVVEEEPAEEEAAEVELIEEETVAEETIEEQPVVEEEPVIEAQTVEEEPAEEQPVANVLTYNGEAQALVEAQGAWLYSVDSENYSEDIPTAVDAGEYTVYFKAADDTEPEALTVTIAKADVTFTPPVAAYIEG